MPKVVTSVTFLQDLPLYIREKPYYVLLAQQDDKDENTHQISNLQFEEISGIEILDLRQATGDFSLETSGFQLIRFKSAHLPVESHNQVEAYRAETEAFLRNEFDALKVICWEIRVMPHPRLSPGDTPTLAIDLDSNDQS
jgi:GT2 family glycosyltransferase